LWERIRRPNERSEFLAEVGEGLLLQLEVSDNVLHHLCEGDALMKPKAAIEDDRNIRLSIEDQIRFAEMLAYPTEPNAAMKRAQEAYKRLIVSSE
jgi:uncharacterized protein (DUF1778 family)